MKYLKIVVFAMVWLIACVVLIHSPAVVFAQSTSAPTVTCTTATIPVCSIGQTAQDVQVKPQTIPQTLTKVAVIDAYIKGCSIYQPSGVTVTLQDNQASPIPIIPATSFSVATQTSFLFGPSPSQPGQGLITYGYYAPGGFSISASGSGAYFQCAWRQ